MEVKELEPVSTFRDGWVDVNGVSSHVLTWGGWIEDDLPEGDSIVLFMCGVPGVTLFYKSFLEGIYDRLNVPVWTICIAGQEIPPSESNLSLTEDDSLYNSVRAQVDHKLDFINKYVPKNRKIILIGHSFGGKMITELLRDEKLRSRTEKCLLLMPTIERFEEAPRAKFWLKVSKVGLDYMLILWVWILSLFPVFLRRLLSRWYFHSRGFDKWDQSCEEAMIHFLNPTIFRNVRSLVTDEVTAIRELDKDVLSKVTDKVKVYFAEDDYWAPLTHYHSLRAALPELPVEILDSRFIHAFSITTSLDMVDVLVKDLKTKNE